MKTQINSPLASKINWTALVMALVNIVAVAGYIPEAYVPHVLSVVNLAGPALIVLFRSKFTDPS